MKISIYTVTDCQFSKQEKEYLASHQLQYEEKNLETNKEFLTEMLTISNNFAGTPVTKIEKDDGQIVVLKGFTKEEYDNALGFEVTQAQSTISAPPAPEPPKPVPPPVPTPPPPTPMPTPPVPEPTPQLKVDRPLDETPPPVPTEPETPIVPPPPQSTLPQTPAPEPIDPQLSSILSNLQEKSDNKQSPQPKADRPLDETSPSVNPVAAAPPAAIPSVPDFQDK